MTRHDADFDARVETGADRVIVNRDPYYADGRPVRRTSWGAVLAGALVALMTTLLLNLLFAGIGLASFNPATSDQPLAGYGTTGLIALILTNVIALFLGGYVAGKLAGSPRRSDNVIHGVLTWALLTLGTVALLSTALGRIVGGVAGAVGNTVSSVTETVAAAAPAAADAAQDQGVTVNAVQNQVNQWLSEAGVQNPEQTSQELVSRIQERIQNGESLTSPEAQEELTTFLANNSELTEQEIDQQVQQLQIQAEETAEQVVETTEEVSQIAGTTAIILFGVLLLGALIAVLGANAGAPKDALDARAA